MAYGGQVRPSHSSGPRVSVLISRIGASSDDCHSLGLSLGRLKPPSEAVVRGLGMVVVFQVLVHDARMPVSQPRAAGLIGYMSFRDLYRHSVDCLLAGGSDSRQKLLRSQNSVIQHKSARRGKQDSWVVCQLCVHIAGRQNTNQILRGACTLGLSELAPMAFREVQARQGRSGR